VGKLFSVLGNASSGITVWQAAGPVGVVMLTVATAFWGWAASWGYLPVFLAAAFIFVSTLWSWIGILMLLDRKKPITPVATSLIRDCSWGLEIGNIVLNHDPSNNINRWRFFFNIHSKNSNPLRFIIEECRIIINMRVANVDTSNFKSVSIITSNDTKQFSIGRFGVGEFEHLGSATGSIYLKINYGHPDDGYSRSMVRSYDVECSYSGTLPPFPFKINVSRVPLEETDLEIPM